MTKPPPRGSVLATDPVRAAIDANKPLFVAGLGFSAAMSILALTTSFYMLQVYDRVLSSRSEETLLLLTIMAFVAIAVFATLDSLRTRILARAGIRTADLIAGDALRAMVATTSRNGGRDIRFGLRDIETVRNFIASPGFTALMDAPFVIVYLVVLTLLHPIFLAIVLLGGAILVTIALVSQRTTDPVLARGIGLSMRAHAFAEGGLRNADVLEGMGMSPVFAARWRRGWVESLRVMTAASDRDSKLSSLSKAVRMLIQITLLGAGAMLILDFRATGGIMIGASIIGARALAPIETIVSSWKNLVAVRLAWQRIGTLMREAPRREEGMALPPPAGRLQAAGVQYITPAARQTILAGIDFEIAPGESLGIIGPSGSGKSTLLRLLVGAWPCTTGNVRLDGADIYVWPRAELGGHIGYLPQDVELFSGTVQENIARMGEGDPQTIVRAAMRAHAHEMILSLPKGYDTEIGENGHDLSGGQAQRIGIARAFYGDPRLVVLDEPNANLDSAGEDALMTAIGELKAQGVTVVIVAHRPSILAAVDKMLVLRANGTMEAFGPRNDIMLRFTRPPVMSVVPGGHP